MRYAARLAKAHPSCAATGSTTTRTHSSTKRVSAAGAWLDRDPNIHGLAGYGVEESGEPGLAGVVFHLFSSDGTPVASTVSDANGIYYFSNVPAGTYFVRAVTPSGLGPSHNDCGGATVYCDDTIDSDFAGSFNDSAAFVLPLNGSINHLDAGFSVPIRD